MKIVKVADFQISNSFPITIFGGMNVLESRDLAFSICDAFVTATNNLNIPYVFKASFDKANRSSIASYRGPGIYEGLRLLDDIKRAFGVPVLTDVHEPEQAAMVAEVADVLQLPAFLARQTDLVIALAKTGKPLNVKKPQFMSPGQVKHVVSKAAEAGNDNVLLCERGASFGYDNLIVDMLGFRVMREVSAGCPIVFDITHSLQIRESLADASGGRRAQLLELARAGVAVGLAALFLEAHPDPTVALCDGPSALPLNKLDGFLRQVKAFDDLAKSLPAIQID